MSVEPSGPHIGEYNSQGANKSNTTMSCKSLPMTPTPLQVRRPGFDDDLQSEQLNHNPTTSSSQWQIVTSSSFHLPSDWVVEKKPRVSNPTHVDKYYYEPHTGKKFRSLLSVQRYLAGETVDYVLPKRRVSENGNTKYIESGAGQQFGSLRAVEKFLSGENACRATPKVQNPSKQIIFGLTINIVVSAMKSETGQQRACGVRSSRKPAHNRSSEAEDKIALKSLKHTVQSVKPDSQKKTKSGKDNRGPMHNLTAPLPAKVSWVLSGPGGFWSPFLDDSIVPDSEKLKWSEAF
ncbi:Methyl-CpG-binding domain-containing protein 7, partial [Mucuna pruriens]